MAPKKGGGKRKGRDEGHLTPTGGAVQHLPSSQIQVPDVEALPVADRTILADIQALGHYPERNSALSRGLKRRASEMDPVCLAYIEAIKRYGGVAEAGAAARRTVGALSASSMSAAVGKGKIPDAGQVMPDGGAVQNLPSSLVQMPDVAALPVADRRILAAIEALGHFPNDLMVDERNLFQRLKRRAGKMDPVCLAFIKAIKQYGGVMQAREVAQRSVGASSSSSTSAVVGKRKIRDEDHVTPVGGSAQ